MTHIEALKRLADPDDSCHEGYKGPWQDVAQEALFGRPVLDEEWWTENGRLTVDEMIACMKPEVIS